MATKPKKAIATKRTRVTAKRSLLLDIRHLIEETRAAVAVTVNAGLTMLYWQIGERINAEILKGSRAEYGKQIVATLSQELTEEYGQGFNYSALTRMSRFGEVFPDFKIVATLSRQLSWSHFKELLPLEKTLQRDFYAEMCRLERWSVRALRKKIDSMLYERTAISRKPEAVIRHELDTDSATGRRGWTGSHAVTNKPRLYDSIWEILNTPCPMFGRGGNCERGACGIAGGYRMRRNIMRAENAGLMIVWTGL